MSRRDGSRDVVRLARPPLSVTAVELPHGGHSPALWRRTAEPAFDWRSGHLARTVPATGGAHPVGRGALT